MFEPSLEQQPAQSSIESLSRACRDTYEHLAMVLSDAQTTNTVSASACLDELGRFRIWANNIGAFLKPHKQASLDFRIRQAPDIQERIQEYLADLRDALQNINDIATGTRPNRSSIDPLGEGTISEIEESFKIAKTCVTSLMRVSIIIRNATPRDRYAQADRNITEPFDESFDTDHVRHKFPRAKPWLQIRLGQAMTKRREFLRYSREHRNKLQESKAPFTSSSNEIRPNEKLASDGNVKIPTEHVEINTALSLAPTKASTLHVAKLMSSKATEDDQRSQVSYATTMDGLDAESKLRVPRLGDICQEPPFECPYCCHMVDLMSQQKWACHVFIDLRPYICTFEDCSLKLFEDKYTWFNHEMSHHRFEWCCRLCDHPPFFQEVEFKTHLYRHTPNATDSQLVLLANASRRQASSIRASSCPLCDWDQKLRALNKGTSLEEKLVVTPQQFRRHLGSHMEQLALFTLPRIPKDEENLGSNEVIDAAGSRDLSKLGSYSIGTQSYASESSGSVESYDEGRQTEEREVEMMEKTKEMRRSENSEQMLNQMKKEKKMKFLYQVLCEEALGEQRPYTLEHMSQLAYTLEDRGKYLEAEVIHRQALDLVEKTLGKQHPDTLKHMRKIAYMLIKQDSFVGAEAMYRQMLGADSQQILGKQDPNTTLTDMITLVWLVSKQGRYSEAVTIHGQALSFVKKMLRGKQVDTLTSMDELAKILLEQRKYEEAEEIYRNSLDLSKEVDCGQYQGTASIMGTLYAVLHLQGKTNEAENIYKRHHLPI